jgi:hypothetical protein
LAIDIHIGVHPIKRVIFRFHVAEYNQLFRRWNLSLKRAVTIALRMRERFSPSHEPDQFAKAIKDIIII